MKITDSYVDNTGMTGRVKNKNGSNLTGFLAGDIIEGLVTETAKGSASGVRFEVNGEERDIRLPNGMVQNTYVGDRRRFEVVEAGTDKLVLKDLGSVAGTSVASGICFMDVDTGLTHMVDDFSETMGDKEKEDEDPIKRLSDDDYSELRTEGFSIEEYKAERLAKAIERVKKGREQREADVEGLKSDLRRERRNTILTALKSYIRAQESGEALTELSQYVLAYADLPVTQENLADIAGAVGMAKCAEELSNDSMAYLIRNGCEPTPRDIYRAVYAGRARYEAVPDKVLSELKNDIDNVVRESVSEAAALPKGLMEAVPTQEDAKWMLEYDIPLTSDNLIYKKELEKLKEDCSERYVLQEENGEDSQGENLPRNYYIRTIEAAIDAIYRGRKAEDALLIDADRAGKEELSKQLEPAIRDINARLERENARLTLMVSSAVALAGRGISVSAEEIETVIDGLKSLESEMYRALYDEVGEPQTAARDMNYVEGFETLASAAEKTAGVSAEDAAALAVKTADAVWMVKTSPDTLLTSTYEVRSSIRFAELAERAQYVSEDLRAKGTEYELAVADTAAPERLRGMHPSVTGSVISAYEASETEVRSDLGDSITKAFRNVDEILASEGMEPTEANRRAVRILGHNGAAINRESVEGIKYYDAKLTHAVSRMQPVMVMSMIRRGINPLDEDLDSLNRVIDTIEAEEGKAPEQEYSSFLVKLEEAGGITENERAAYIGIYRLLYRIGTRDSAALGAALRSDRELTLRNLMTEVRSYRASGIDAVIDDETAGEHASYTNSVTGQIDEAIAYQSALVRRMSAVTEPEVWHEALSGTEASDLSLEALSEKLFAADNMFSPDNSGEAAAVRAVMAGSANTGEFLRAFGVKKSVNNLRAAEDDNGADMSREGLLEALTSEDELDERYEEAVSSREQELRDMLTGDDETIEIKASAADSITGQLRRFGLLRQLAEEGHYSFSVGEEDNIRVNLTVIRGQADKGRIEIALERETGTVRADLGIYRDRYTGESELYGTIGCDSRESLDGNTAMYEGFLNVAEKHGYGTKEIRLMVDPLKKNQYRDRLTAMKNRADAELTDGDTEVAETGELIRVARMFLERFL